MENKSIDIVDESKKSIGRLSDIELNYTYWQSKDNWFIGFLDIWPEHLTQGHDLNELEEMLADLYKFYKEEIDNKIVRKTGRIKIPT